MACGWLTGRERVLLALEEGERRPGELSRAAGLGRRALSRVLERLQREGLVEPGGGGGFPAYKLTDRGREEAERVRLHLLLERAVERSGSARVGALLHRLADGRGEGVFAINAYTISSWRRIPLRWLYERSGSWEKLAIPWRKDWVAFPSFDGWIVVEVGSADAVLAGDELTLTIGGSETVTLSGEEELERFVADVLRKRREALEERLRHVVGLTPIPYRTLAEVATELELITCGSVEAVLRTHEGRTLTLLSATTDRLLAVP